MLRPILARAALPIAILGGLGGCEQVESSGSPFEPVAIEATASAASGTVPPPIPALAWPDDKLFKASVDGSGDMKVESAPEEVEVEKPDAKSPEGSMASLFAAADGEESNAAVAPPEPASAGAATLTTPPPAMSAPPVAEPTQVGGWPVRLVKTVQDAQPPRAILGLPGGKEIVVTPGAMVPEEGLVVLAIGPGKVQLSQVAPQGDHASITSFTLEAMY